MTYYPWVAVASEYPTRFGWIVRFFPPTTTTRSSDNKAKERTASLRQNKKKETGETFETMRHVKNSEQLHLTKLENTLTIIVICTYVI